MSSQSEWGLLDFCQITILRMDLLIVERVVADHFTLRVHLLMVEVFVYQFPLEIYLLKMERLSMPSKFYA